MQITELKKPAEAPCHQRGVLDLLPRIEAHIRQLSPHMMQRDGVVLLREARDEIENLRKMYNAQCACTDEGAEKYRAELDPKVDAILLERVEEH